MTAPKRIQRRRTKGWRMPPNTVCVTRPGKWGNPYRVWSTGPESCRCWYVGTSRTCAIYCYTKDEAIRSCIERYKLDLILQPRERWCPPTRDDVRRELRGKNLACWCPIGSPCHADVLLEIANSEEP